MMVKKIKNFIVASYLVLAVFIIILFIALSISSFKDSVFVSIFLFVLSVPFMITAWKSVSYLRKKEKNEIVCDRELPASYNKVSESNYLPEYEISYIDSNGELTVRQIKIINFKGRTITAFCFLRNANRTFVVSKIKECIDISTGVLIDEELHFYFNRKFNKRFEISEMFSFEEWCCAEFVDVAAIPEDIEGFDLNEFLNLRFYDYKAGEIYGSFKCGKIHSSLFNQGQFYISVTSANGDVFNVDFGKIFFVENIENFVNYVVNKFKNSDLFKSQSLLRNHGLELEILAYLGRVNSSISKTKRKVIVDYFASTGFSCDDNIVALSLRNVTVDLNKFQKNVDCFAVSKTASEKDRLLSYSYEIIGNLENKSILCRDAVRYIREKF